MAAVSVLLFAQIVALWPSHLDLSQSDTTPGQPNPSGTPATAEPTFPGFEPPEGATPDYGIAGFHYVSVLKGLKQWLLQAREADFYSKQQWVHARTVVAQLYSDESSSIEVRGSQARYSMSTRDLDVGGQVVARFPDGSELKSELLEFKPAEKRVGVPVRYRVRGKGPASAPAILEFESLGMSGMLQTGIFELISQVRIQVRSRNPGQSPTEIRAPKAIYHRLEGLLELRSVAGQPVHLEQAGLKSTANQMEVRMPLGAKKASFIARDDVKIEEWKKSGGRSTPDRYSTCGRAEFDPDKQEILLSEYPQVYQDGDTMTGESIRILRAQDQVEVEETNAYTQGRPKKGVH
jgi:LPS export ABC transporter protein LptC